MQLNADSLNMTLNRCMIKVRLWGRDKDRKFYNCYI